MASLSYGCISFFIWAVILIGGTSLMWNKDYPQDKRGGFRFVAKETTSCLLKCASSNPIQLDRPPLVKIRCATALVNHDAIQPEV